MNRFAWFVLVTAFHCLIVSGICAQLVPSTSNAEQRRQFEMAARVEADLERRMRNMRQLESKMAALSKLDSTRAASPPELDKKAKERVMELRRIDPADIAKYRDFLNAERTGIFRLFPDFDCLSKNVIKIDGKCESFVPESSSFSFRAHAYTDEYYHDFGYNNDKFVSGAFFTQGILVSLGDQAIEGVDLSHPGMKFLVDFRPVTDPAAARRDAQKVRIGIESGEYRYSQTLDPTENATYGLRTIAYRLQNSLPPLTLKSTLLEMRFHSLKHDERVDSIIVFRIISKEPDGATTIVWKELNRQDAPMIKFPKGEMLADFKP